MNIIINKDSISFDPGRVYQSVKVARAAIHEPASAAFSAGRVGFFFLHAHPKLRPFSVGTCHSS
jgi:hypothetical protein